jgi:hypothetical protein
LGDGEDIIQDSAGGDSEELDENVLQLGADINFENIKQEFIPATVNSLGQIRVTILNNQQQSVGCLVVLFPDSASQVTSLGLQVRLHSGKAIMLATPNNDKIAGTLVDDFIDSLSGDDIVEAGSGNDTISGGTGDDQISCGTGDNLVTGGPGDDTIFVEGGRDLYFWNLGDGHDQIIRKIPNYERDSSINGRIIFGAGILPIHLSFEVLNQLPNNDGSLKITVKNDANQVVGSITLKNILGIIEGFYPFSNLLPGSSAYLRGDSYKEWKERGPSWSWIEDDKFSIKFSDQRIWNLNIGGSAFIKKSIDSSDTDQDGMDDQWEILYGMNPISQWEGESFVTHDDDLDGDGVSNIKEYVYRRNPTVADPVIPLIIDYSGDSDADLMSLAYETANGLDTGFNDSMDDKDRDGFPNVWEFIRGTRSDDQDDFPQPDYIVDKDSGTFSVSDNIFSSLGEAARFANSYFVSDISRPGNIIAVKSGDYIESVIFDRSVLLLGEPGSNKKIPTIRCPEDRQTVALMSNNDVQWQHPQPGCLISGFRITHTDGKNGPAIVSNSALFLKNCVIDHNRTDFGSAFFGRVTQIDHCTIFNNSSQDGIYYGWAARTVKIRNSILWKNGINVPNQISGYPEDDLITYVVENSIIQGGFMGAINQDPQLNHLGSLKSTSPAIGALVPPASSQQVRDIHGEDRDLGGMHDIGADEYQDNNGAADGDGIPDWVELAVDADSLPSVVEYATHLTDPFLSDTDFDGLNDDDEILIHFTNPLSADMDADGISDGIEIRIGTPASVANNDGDSLPDEWEFDHGLNPNVNDSLLDLDGDSLTNAQEHALGTDPGNKDTDGDGMTDDWEVANSQDPLQVSPTPLTVQADADSDGLIGWTEVAFGSSDQQADTDSDGWNDAFEFLGQTTPTVPDSDGDGVQDLDEDSDGDGLSNRQELEVHFTNPVSKDTDGDEVDDDREILSQMNPNDPADGGADLDGDGLTTSKELAIGTNPGLKDSDQDGVSDGLEYGGGLDPLRSDSDSDSVADLDEDTDGDGLTNRVEFELSTHMLHQDTDRDGINDSLEN